MKRYFSVFMAVLILLTALAGCGQTPAATDPSTSETVPNGTQPNTPEDTEPVEPPDPPVELIPGNVVISEVMPDNEKLCLGHEYDWVEIHNLDTDALVLDGYYLTDDPSKPALLDLSGMTVPGEGYLVITLDDAAPFRLSATGESVYLVCGESFISKLTYGAPEDGESMDENGACQWPSPGFANTRDGYLAYLEALTLPELIISEVMSSNSKLYPVNGKNYDMIEVYNNSASALNLSDYCLSDKRSEPSRYAFPDVTLQPGECYVVYCSGDTGLGKDHASFKLSADGETVYLSKNGSFVDALKIPADLGKNQSYGRVGNIPMYLSTPSFGSTNTAGRIDPLAAPAANIPTGLYDESQTVTLSAEGDIYYTLDGTAPTTDSMLYTGPITIDGVCTIRTFCVSGETASAEQAYTYVIGAQHDLPVAVISIPQDSLTGETGVLNHIEEDYEHAAMLTLIENGEEQFSIPFGFRLHGNDSRKGDKQNFQLRFRSIYGAEKLNYPLFEDRDFTEYNSLLLKGGSEAWAMSMLTDELATAMADGTALYIQAMKPVVLYLGGEYWGVYYFRERFSDEYVESHLDVPAESVDILSSTSASVQNGSKSDFLALRKFCQENDMSLEENFDYLASQIDVTSLMDWYICRSYVGDRDLANIRRFRSVEGDGLWRWMYFDLDWSFYHYDNTYFSWLVENRNGEPILMRAVIASEKGQDLFLKRCAELFDTVLNEENTLSILDSIVSAIESEMPRDRERWGCKLSSWEKQVQKLRDFVADNHRTKGMIADLQDYFNLTDAEVEAYFGGL